MELAQSCGQTDIITNKNCYNNIIKIIKIDGNECFGEKIEQRRGRGSGRRGDGCD